MGDPGIWGVLGGPWWCLGLESPGNPGGPWDWGGPVRSPPLPEGGLQERGCKEPSVCETWGEW